jgi:hypothetical protein
MGLRWRLCAGTKCQILTTSWWLELDQSGASINLYPNGDRMLAMDIDSPHSSKSRSMVYRREIVAHGSILALRDGEPWETKDTNRRALDHDHIA